MDYPLLSPKYYYSLLKDILNFVKNPIPDSNTVKTTKTKIYDTIGLFVVKLFFLIPISVLVGFIHDPENLTKSNMAERFSPLVLILVAVIILPTIEEACFRLSLKFKPSYLALSTGILAYYISTKIIFHTRISAIDDSFLIRLSTAIGVAFICFLILQFNPVKKALARFWNKHFSWIYYLSCLSFAWIHIFNYELNWTNLLFLPLITLPQLMSAIIAGYTRVAFGFQYPLLFHMSTNLIAITLSFLPFAD